MTDVQTTPAAATSARAGFRHAPSKRRSVLFGTATVVGALALTVLFFLVLPLLQAITSSPPPRQDLVEVDAGNLPPPPPPPPEEEPEEEPEPEEPEPQLEEQAPPLDLSQLELALNPGGGGGWATGDFGVRLDTVGGEGDGGAALFSLADLDQKPRPVYQPSPRISASLQKKAPATVYVLFIVDESGRVKNPIVQKSTDPAFEKAAVSAVKKWKFEPGQRGGEPVQFRMRVPVTFPRS